MENMYVLITALIAIPLAFLVLGFTNKFIYLEYKKSVKWMSKIEKYFMYYPSITGFRIRKYWRSIIVSLCILIIAYFYSTYLLSLVFIIGLSSYINGLLFDQDTYYNHNIKILDLLSYCLISIPSNYGRRLWEKIS